MIWQCRDYHLDCSRTLLMGVLNLTPDSFSDGGRFVDPSKAINQAFQMVQEGADILDLGGESTRPGAQAVSVEEELRRIIPVLDPLKGKIPIPISVDTTKPEVADICLQKGADIINDVSGLKDSGGPMAALIKAYGAGIVLMHRRGNPLTMQTLTQYEDVVSEVLRELKESCQIAERAGIDPSQIAIDPGLGFAKTAEQNCEMIRNLERFQVLNRPILLGPSRKSFIGKIIGREANEREMGTAAVCAVAVTKRVNILRVHEIGRMRDVVLMAEAIRGGDYVRAFKMGKY
ncbi:MAG: dihydropteroate synthase [Candidatus Omnitrophica bacterium]|nr:dihydropteroate synthase [Candidatus Omnitrophota bacterium]